MSATENSPVTIPSEIVPVPSTTTDSPSLPNSSQTVTILDQPLPAVGDQTGDPPSLPHSKPKWLSIFNALSSNRKKSNPKPAAASAATPTAAGAAIHSAAELLALYNLIDQDLSFITQTCEKLEIYKGHVNDQAKKAREQLETLKSRGENKDDLRKLKRTVTKLKVHISSKYKDRSDDPHRNKRLNDSAKLKMISEDELLKIISQFYNSEELTNSTQFQDFKKLYDGLRIELKLCLLCFAVFPEDAVIKKRFMIYWWMGENFVPPIDVESEKTAEEFANEFFYELMEKGFIQPVFKKPNLMADSCRMHPFIRSIVLQLALRARFFDFGDKGNPTEKYSDSFRACLVGEGLVNQQELEKLHMLFNVNEEILDFKPEWFLRMRNINLLSLGRWQTSPTHHIELEETNFLDGLSIMNHLRLFSLQGVSRIMELPVSIANLINLTILDLRACHNLEVIPKEIGILKSLTHLDMSECYLLEHMPKELSLLSNLQVLKGFVVGVSKNKNSCTLHDLAKLRNLRKLNIYTGFKKFPSDTDLRAFQEFESLKKLTIAWGGGASHAKGEDTKKEENSSMKKRSGSVKKPHPHKSFTRQSAFKLELGALEKLDLQCFPHKHATNWLTPSNLKGLKKLYIRGGKLSDLGQYLDFVESIGDELPIKESWKIEVLRLKYLSELEMDWKEMHELFPDLIYLEKVNCPKLTFFPCDESGVWMNKTKLKQLEETRS